LTNVDETNDAGSDDEHVALADASNQEPEMNGDTTDREAFGTQGMIPGRRRRGSSFERISMRILATGGIIGLDVALGAILGANHVQGWIDGLTIGLVSVLLAAVLWSSRQL
jgi:hypothetical protein